MGVQGDDCGVGGRAAIKHEPTSFEASEQLDPGYSRQCGCGGVPCKTSKEIPKVVEMCLVFLVLVVARGKRSEKDATRGVRAGGGKGRRDVRKRSPRASGKRVRKAVLVKEEFTVEVHHGDNKIVDAQHERAPIPVAVEAPRSNID